MKNLELTHQSLFESIVSSIKNQNNEHFIKLIRIAKADGVICTNELKLLKKIGRKMKFSDNEIRNLIELTINFDYIPPKDLFNCFEQVYDIVKIILADGIIEKNEMRLASFYATKSGFSENEIPNLFSLLIGGIREGKSAEALFKTFKKE